MRPSLSRAVVPKPSRAARSEWPPRSRKKSSSSDTSRGWNRALQTSHKRCSESVDQRGGRGLRRVSDPRRWQRCAVEFTARQPWQIGDGLDQRGHHPRRQPSPQLRMDKLFVYSALHFAVRHKRSTADLREHFREERMPPRGHHRSAAAPIQFHPIPPASRAA